MEKETKSLFTFFRDSDGSKMSQFQNEYETCWKDQKSKKDEWGLRLKLYNNQRRDKEAVGDTTLFTILQTILASLYADRLMVEWSGRTEGDEQVAENLNKLADYDYDQMEKDELDYIWDWDTCFFGRGLLLFHEFHRDPDKNIYLPVPEVLDPMTFLRDPRADSVNSTRFAKNAMRFGGREIKMTEDEMRSHPNFFKEIKFKDLKLTTESNIKSLNQDAETARAEAQGRDFDKLKDEEGLGPNAEYTLLEWFTHIKMDGVVKKAQLWLADDKKTVVGARIIGDREDKWPIIDRSLYPTSHDWDGASIPDLVEDKQRARAVLQNLGLRSMKADLYPMYLYDTNKIKNEKSLDFDFNKFIPVDSGSPVDAIAPLRKDQPNMSLLGFIYNSLDVSAQKSTATPEIQQGMMSSVERTLGELNLVASKVDTRYSLSAKIFGWSEKRFWRQWYKLYKDNFEDKIDEKVLRLAGPFGPKWRPLLRENIVAEVDPDVRIESKNVSRAYQMEERQALSNYFSIAFQDPTINRRWAEKKLAKSFGMDSDEIDRLFPQTIDERIAEDQNKLLNENMPAPVLAEDDHLVHLECHQRANDTKAAYAHIETHKAALMLKKSNPDLFPAPEAQAGANAYQPMALNPAPTSTPGQQSQTGQGTTSRKKLSDQTVKPSETSNMSQMN